MKKTLVYAAIVMGLLSLTMPYVAQAITVTPSAKPSTAASVQANLKNRLTAAKLKVCQNKANAIDQRSDQLTKMATKMLSTFDSIATRVETYYASKAVPAGKTVSNYDALVSDINTKKQKVQTDLTKAQTDAAAFSCTSDDPKAQLALFRTDMQTVKTDLKNYRTSIKNLIVAIRSVNGTSASPSPSSSSSPSPSSSL